MSDEKSWKILVDKKLLTDTSIDNASLRLYLILMTYARNKDVAFPSRETLAKDMGVSVKHIDTLKRRLVEKGLIDWRSEKKSGFIRKNIYTIKENVNKDNSYLDKIKNDELIKQVVDTWINSYKNFCLNSKDIIKDHLEGAWVYNPIYNPTKSDYKNLSKFKAIYKDSGLLKLKDAFSVLGDYLTEQILWGDFHYKGKEIIPTISLYTYKNQFDKLYQFYNREI